MKPLMLYELLARERISFRRHCRPHLQSALPLLPAIDKDISSGVKAGRKDAAKANNFPPLRDEQEGR